MRLGFASATAPGSFGGSQIRTVIPDDSQSGLLPARIGHGAETATAAVPIKHRGARRPVVIHKVNIMAKSKLTAGLEQRLSELENENMGLQNDLISTEAQITALQCKLDAALTALETKGAFAQANGHQVAQALSEDALTAWWETRVTGYTAMNRSQRGQARARFEFISRTGKTPEEVRASFAK